MKKSSYLSDEISSIFWPLFCNNLKSTKTQQTYWSDINSFVDYVQKDFLEISPVDVENYYLFCTKDGSIKLATLQKKIRELSSFSDFIVENIEEQIGECDFSNYFFEKLGELNSLVKMSKGHIPTIKEMDKLLTAARNDIMYYTIMALIFRCAVKPSEIIKIRQCDFAQDQYGNCYLELGDKKSARTIPLPEDVVQILDSYNLQRKKTATFFFYKSTMEGLTERALERKIQDYASAAKVSPITMYGIRDASVALMCASGAPDSIIARDTGLTERGISRYKEIVPPYLLQHSAIGMVNICINKPN